MITIILIVLTSIISILAFREHSMMNRMIFYPPAVRSGEWHRLFTYGFLHADYMHLIFNMFTLYFFGMDIERFCKIQLGENWGALCFIILYLTALPVSILPTYFKQKENRNYHSLGASGAVSAVIFAYMLINPMNFMGILFIPVMLPAFLFGIIFLLISMSLDKKESGNINHSAHITGGIYGIIYMIVLFRIVAGANLIESFFSQIRIDSLSDLFHIGF
ncbi:MAG: Rhomboid family protein [Proteiniphilum acetatigenes]|uniref:Rhomboid family protein n=1 Tax=Proteiniphilum acetatigenes TaxID=294710 RepID=A0A101HCT2_9BACT|nr:MAG: Rhomboid family protein [Proteiniphilum acetatigenes]MBZ4652198.1 Rhomboid family protein (Precursor) [Proteiniphilum sp.]HCC85131.1 rhomboid family intramembrane serine protease [Porphyromonadaceae bacterium]